MIFPHSYPHTHTLTPHTHSPHTHTFTPTPTHPQTPPPHTHTLTHPTAPNAPDGLMVVPSTADPYRTLDISWDLPTQPSGVLLRCTIVVNPDASRSIIPLAGPLTSHILTNRAPDTEYTFQVFCSNTFPGALSGTMTGRTLVGGQYSY